MKRGFVLWGLVSLLSIPLTMIAQQPTTASQETQQQAQELSEQLTQLQASIKELQTQQQQLQAQQKTLQQQASLEFTGIDPFHPFRFAVDEKKALTDIFTLVKKAIAAAQCHRGVLVGHNIAFDLSFLNAAIARCQLKSPFHRFTTLDTAALSALAFGQTVLAKAALAAKIPFNVSEAHSAIYDAERTAELFCHIVNRWQELGGWEYG